MASKLLAVALVFTTLAAASSSSSSSSSHLRGDINAHHDNVQKDKDFLPLQEPETRFQAGSLSTWLEEHIWDHAPLADVVLFRLPVPNDGKNKNNTLKSKRRLQVEEDTVVVPNPGEDLVVSVSFRDIYKTIFFIAVAWLLGMLSVYVGLPSLVGEISAGFLLGPPLADFVPYPGALVLAGNIGLIGLILESGIGLDVAQLKEVGRRALLLAIVGSALPLLAGFGVGQWIGKDIKPSIAVGAAFAPSSLGVASAALSTEGVLNTPIGQLIVASSVFDDVFGLILLSIIEVFANPNPAAFDYIRPFLASFGYLIVLGYLGITKLPKLIEKRILPLVPEAGRDQFAMVLMMMLMIAYMLALNYSGASYLTGVFLAGMTFSQINTVHAYFVTYGRPLLEWLLRIFFAATIGFQVPIKYFGNPYVVKWGLALLLPVFAKAPLGLLIPHFQKATPDDFPYNPYLRDVVITSLSMTCRGEFNFIVASYALSQGLFLPEAYSAVIFAVLFGSIACPLVLSRVLRYYNDKSLEYLQGKHPIERIGSTGDGLRPLFLAIQARTPVHWSLQEAFEKTLTEMGLLIIDHRSWHTLGMSAEAVDITELFVQDTKVKVRLKGCFGSLVRPPSKEDVSIRMSIDSDSAIAALVKSVETADTPDACSVEVGLDEELEIRSRCNEIKDALTECLGSDTSPQDYAIQVSQWKAFLVEKADSSDTSDSESDSNEPKPLKKRYYSFHSMNENDDKNESNNSPEPTSQDDSGDTENKDTGHNRTPSLHRIGSNMLRRLNSHPIPEQLPEEPCLSAPDLWELDETCLDATRTGYTFTPDYMGNGMHHVADGPGLGAEANQNAPPIPVQTRRGHNRAVSFDFAVLTSQPSTEREMETFVVRERLHGYVRHPLAPLPQTG